MSFAQTGVVGRGIVVGPQVACGSADHGRPGSDPTGDRQAPDDLRRPYAGSVGLTGPKGGRTLQQLDVLG